MASDDAELDAGRRAALSPLLTFNDFKPLSASVRVEVGATSQRGNLPRLNDDHYLALRLRRQQEVLATSLSSADLPPKFEESGYAFLVADGLGEHGAGSVASRIAISTIAHLALHYGQWNMRIDPKTATEILDRAEWFYTRADAAVSNKTRTTPVLGSMATALTIAYSAGDDLFVVHVGHSRAYLFRNGQMIQLTRDQTTRADRTPVAGTAPEAPFPILVDGRVRDLGHILTDAIGAGGGSPAVQVEQFRLLDGDCVMLCTNGLTDALDDEEIAEVLSRRGRPADQCVTLAELANQAGGEDNVTIVLAQYQVPE